MISAYPSVTAKRLSEGMACEREPTGPVTDCQPEPELSGLLATVLSLPLWWVYAGNRTMSRWGKLGDRSLYSRGKPSYLS